MNNLSYSESTATTRTINFSHDDIDYVDVEVDFEPSYDSPTKIETAADGKTLTVSYLSDDPDRTDLNPLSSDVEDQAILSDYDSSTEDGYFGCDFCGETESEHPVATNHLGYDCPEFVKTITRTDLDSHWTFLFVSDYVTRYNIVPIANIGDVEKNEFPYAGSRENNHVLELDRNNLKGFADTNSDEHMAARLEIAEAWAKEYSSWATGEIYGIVSVVVDVATGDAIDAESNSCWGFLGEDNAKENLASGSW